LEAVRKSFRRAFCDDVRINAVVGSTEIKTLAVLRHLLVHKVGVVDQKFLNQCSEKPAITEFSKFGIDEDSR